MLKIKILINKFCLKIARNVYFYYLYERKEGKPRTQNFTTWSNFQLMKHENFINNRK